MRNKKIKIFILLFVTLVYGFVPAGLVYAEGEEPAAEELATEESATEESTQDSAVEVSDEDLTDESGEETEAESSEAETTPLTETENKDSSSSDDAESMTDPVDETDTEEVVEKNDEADVAEIVAELSEADIVLVDEQGEAISFASEEASDILSSGDPFFWDGTQWVGYTETGTGCPTNVTCYQDDNPFQKAVSEAGDSNTIYVAAGSYDEDVQITTSNLSFVGFETIDVSGTGTVNSITSGQALVNSFTLSTDFNSTNNVYATIVNILAGTSIQEGVNLVVDGGTVNVAAGTYEEEINIVSKDVNLQGSSGTVIQSPANLGLDANGFRGIIYVNDAIVTINNFVIDGLGRGNANYRFTGINLYNAGGTISNNTVLNITDTPFSGSQHGLGIYVLNDDTVARAVNILNNDISNFQKNGITTNGNDLTANISGNTVTGIGQTSTIAQNGIQLGRGATGSISDNTISDIWYTGSGWSASGILLYEASGTVSLENNIINNSDKGIFVDTTTVQSKGNTISACDYGVLVWGDGTEDSTFEGETIQDSYVGFYNYISNSTVIEGSTFLNNDFGLYDPYSTANAVYNYWGCDEGPDGSACDVCIGAPYDPWLLDPDGDGIFDSSDGTGDYVDNCPNVYNPKQKDSDGDGIGNACDREDEIGYGPGAAAGLPGIIPVTGEGLFALSGSSIDVALSEGDYIRYIALDGYSAAQAYVTSAELPEALPEEYTFLAGMTSTIVDAANMAITELPEDAELLGSFVQREKADGEEFVILYWDASASEWVELDVTLLDGAVQFTSTDLAGGVFILAAK